MLTKTRYNIDNTLFNRICSSDLDIDFKLSINKPTGDFFYDEWVLKDEYVGTVWEELYNSLPVSKGECRIIKLVPGTSYTAHADMDNRYHFNIKGKKSYLIDLDNNVMHSLSQDLTWHYMNAGIYHTAANFGNIDRIQVVVRELLQHVKLSKPVTVTIKVKQQRSDYRYEFDRVLSPWLNTMNTNKKIDNFKHNDNVVTFDLEQDMLYVLQNILPDFLEIV